MSEPMEVQTLPTVWVGLDETPVHAANTFLLQLDADLTGVYLTAGIVIAPPIVGSGEEIKEQLKRYTFVPVNPVARLAMTRARFEELRGLMNQVAMSWPSAETKGGEGQ